MNKTIATAIAIIVCATTALVSCKHETQPKNLVDTATMVAFLTEAHIIESYGEVTIPSKKDSAILVQKGAIDSLLDKYNMTVADYDSSLNYYMEHPKQMENIYRRVTENLKAMKSSYENN